MWPTEIKGLSLRLQGSVGHDIIGKKGRGRVGFRATSPVGLDTLPQPQFCLLPAV